MLASPLSSLEQWAALSAVAAMIPAGTRRAAEPLVRAVVASLSSRARRDAEAGEAALGKLEQDITRAFLRRLDVTSDPPAPEMIAFLAAWLRCGEGPAGSGAVVVVGDDSGRRHGALGAALGLVLGHHGLDLLAVSPGELGAAVTRGYRQQRRGTRSVSVLGDEEDESALRGAGCILLVGGSQRARAICEMARRRGVPLLPAPRTGGLADRLAAQEPDPLGVFGVPSFCLDMLNAEHDAMERAERLVRLCRMVLESRTPRAERITHVLFGAADHGFASSLVHALAEHGEPARLIHEPATHHEAVQQLVERDARRRDPIVVVCSRHLLGHAHVRAELEEALEREARDGLTYVVPLHLDDFAERETAWSALRSRLVARAFVDFRPPCKFREALAELLDALADGTPKRTS